MSSPTRLREDAASESDLVRGGYRDRLLTELAQNAADAAVRAGVPGRLRVWVDDSEGSIHIANTGAPLDVSGVHALTALRASDKTYGVGRFGVGFTSVRSVSDEISVLSRDGGVRFGARSTSEVLENLGLPVPRSGVPVLRLVWPENRAPVEGFDTEIVLIPRADVAVAELLAGFESEAVDLLLELPALERIELDGLDFACARTILDERSSRVEIGERTWQEYRASSARWIVPVVDGSPVPASPDSLRAPTRSDELLSLPAWVIADVAMAPDRRRIMPGTSLESVADGYADFLASLPAEERVRFVPEVGFARSEVDGELRELIFRRLRTAAWLPGADGEDLVPERATVLVDATADLTAVLVDVVANLVDSALSGSRELAALSAIDVRRIGAAELADLLGGIDREPAWWGRLYDALLDSPIAASALAVEELATLPVPLSGGRMVTGPRTVVLSRAVYDGDGGSIADVPWARLVHPDAASALLPRLGTTEASADELLADPALEALLEDLDWDDDEAVDAAGAAVLMLAAHAGELPSWIGGLPLEDADGELRAADELLLPGAPLASLLRADSPFAVVASPVVERFGSRALRAIGVGWGLSVLNVEWPTGPDHDLDDEESWWASVTTEPERFTAVRDLDLVREDAWPQALTVLLDDPATRPAIEDRQGYTAWWLRKHVRLNGAPIDTFRAPSDETFAGLLDPLDHPRADELSTLSAASTCDGVGAANMLLDALADTQRSPTPAVIVRAHRAIASAVRAGTFAVVDLDPPERVRTIGGSVVSADDALVIDAPWWAAVVPTDVAVASDIETAAALADVLDVRCASDAVHAEVVGVGRVSAWDREPGAVLACAVLGLPLPQGRVVMHRELIVRLTGALSGDREVVWWVTEDGIAHCLDRKNSHP